MAKFGNGSYYTKSIDGQDISGYDAKTAILYESIKSAEYAGTSYGTGLYLISNAKSNQTTAGNQGSGNYWTALKTAASNYSSFGASGTNSWLGTVYGSGNAWFVGSNGNVNCNHGQSDSFVLAPAFTLDTSKVVLNGNALTVLQ